MKNDGSEDFKNIVITYLRYKHGKKLEHSAKWYSERNGKLKVSANPPEDIPRIGKYEFCEEIMAERSFKRGEKVIVKMTIKEGSVEGKYIESRVKISSTSRQHLIRLEGEDYWFSDIHVFQKPQKSKKPKKKKKKKFKNGEKVVIYKGRTDEAVACYIGKNPVERKGIHIVLIDGELGTNNVHESFMKKIK